MSFLRHALAGVPAAAVALAATPAQAADVRTLPCVPYVAGEATMPIVATGFAPGAFVSAVTTTVSRPAPAALASGQANPAGGFTALVAPPAFDGPDTHLQSFALVAIDRTNPAAPVQTAPFPFQVVRFGMTRDPNPRRPSTRVTYTARGFTPGKAVYIHFRFKGRTRRTVRLGVAAGACGIVSRRMRALPTRPRYGRWTSYTNTARRFSPSTTPTWKESFEIFRRFR